MREYQSFRLSAIRYWERRRIIYNLALTLPAWFGYSAAKVFAHAGDVPPTSYPYFLFWLILSAIGANICYTFAYALEFLFGNDDPKSAWMQFGRTTAFVAGTAFAMALSFVGGRQIALMEFHELIRRSA